MLKAECGITEDRLNILNEMCLSKASPMDIFNKIQEFATYDVSKEITELEIDIQDHYSDAVKHFLKLINKYEKYYKLCDTDHDIYELISGRLYEFFKNEETVYYGKNPQYDD